MEKAKEWKEKGTQYYKTLQFEDAIKCYSAAALLSPEDPVYEANQSAVQFEIGQYNDCILSVDKSLSLFTSDDQNTSLQLRLLLRKAKCLFYLNKIEEGRKVMEKLDNLSIVSKIASPDTNSSLKKCFDNAQIEHPDYALASNFSGFRNPIKQDIPEYFIVGHDNPRTLFGGIKKETAKKVNEFWESENSEISIEKIQRVASVRNNIQNSSALRIHPAKGETSFLIGGVGDARHIFRSLTDMLANYEPESPLPSVSFTLVDIKAEVLARDLIMFYILKHIANVPRESHFTDMKSIELLSLIYYVCFGVAMPSYLYEILQNIIQELIKDINEKTLPSWIVLDNNTVPHVLSVLNDCLVIVSGKGFLDQFYCCYLGIQPIVFLKSHNEGEGEEKKEKKERKERKERTQILNFLFQYLYENLSKMSDEEIMRSQMLESYPTLQEKRAAIPIIAEKFSKLTNDVLPVSELEQEIHEILGIMSPPPKLHSRHPDFEAVCETEKGTPEREQLIDGLAKNITNNSWKPNPTVWDKQANMFFFKIDWLPYNVMNHYFSKITPAITFLMNSAFNYAGEFFSQVATAIATFSNGIKLEWVFGDIFSYSFEIHKNSQERSSAGLPVKYDRITISNIPDYTGGNLAITSYIAPLLKNLPHAYILYNVLLNTGHFIDVQHVNATYSLIPKLQNSSKFIGMRHLTGTKLSSKIVWQTEETPTSISKLATQEELNDWLYRIFFFVVLPPEQQEPEPVKIYFPLTLICFVKLLRRLEEMGYPRHWLAAVLDSLLSGKVKCKARPPPNSLNIHYPPSEISTVPFLPDLEVAILSELPRYEIRTLSPLPSGFREISLQLDSYIHHTTMKPSFALLICQKEYIPGYQIQMGSKIKNILVDLRCDVVGSTSPCYLLSIVKWNSKTYEAVVVLNEKRIEEWKQQKMYVTPARVDQWITIGTPRSFSKLIKQKK